MSVFRRIEYQCIVYYDISAIHDSDSECASHGVFLPVPSVGRFEYCARGVSRLGSLNSPYVVFSVLLSFCVDDLARVYLCHE